jgi:hypothetical protein
MMENIGTLRLMRSHLQAVRINDGAVIDKQNGRGVMFERFTHSLAGFFSRDYIQDAVAAEIIAWFPMLGFAAQDGISLISPALLHCPVRP